MFNNANLSPNQDTARFCLQPKNSGLHRKDLKCSMEGPARVGLRPETSGFHREGLKSLKERSARFRLRPQSSGLHLEILKFLVQLSFFGAGGRSLRDLVSEQKVQVFSVKASTYWAPAFFSELGRGSRAIWSPT